ncbi:MAG: hypothetical protein ACYCXA_01615 [Actinomycetes bacterium]
MTSGPVVDTPSASEFMREILDRVSAEELAEISGRVAAKSDSFRHLLLDSTPGREELRAVLRQVFALRRRADAIIDDLGAAALAAGTADLLDGPGGLVDRFARFDQMLGEHATVAFDLPGEILHYTDPGRYWLWTRWMWNPRTETGALRLVTMEELDLTRASRGQTYLAVGEAMSFVDETGRAAGFTALGSEGFGLDVYLASVYGVYLYTVLRMRMTQEFTRIVPALPDLTRRLLGVYHREG